MRSTVSLDEKPDRDRTEVVDLERQMRRVSQFVSAAAVALMIAGMLGTVLSGAALSLPGGSVMSLHELLQLPMHPLALAAMSAGILMLALLPMLRVLLALGMYVRQRVLIDAIAALIVLIELLISMKAGSG
ncbi:MAG: DUF1634 domain-containing protein [Anaerolineae bacterium]|nr:DUF1634 domain-containing protein [Anaerolineae bacterium]MCB0255360.1 DUF1634 domain-containing protein [Anaerolineae bacterium]